MNNHYPTGWFPYTTHRMSYYAWHDDPLRRRRASIGYVYNHTNRATEDLDSFLAYTEHLLDTGGTLHGVTALRASNIRPLMRMGPAFQKFDPTSVTRSVYRGRKSKVVTHELPVDLPPLVVVAEGKTARLYNTKTGWTSEPFQRTVAIRLAQALNPTPTEGD